MKCKALVVLVVMVFVMWYAPLLLPVATLHRYGLEEMRVAFTFFVLGCLVTYIYLHERKEMK